MKYGLLKGRNELTSTYIERVLFNTFNTLFMVVLVLVTLYPFWNTVAVALNDGTDSIRGGIYLFPRIPTFHNFKAVFASGTILPAFVMSVTRTVITTVFSVFLTSMFAYALSRKEYVLRKPITTIVVLTMYISAGLIPGYMLIKNLGLINNFLVYVIPGLVGAFNFIMIRTYIHTIPESLVESARMDGAGEFRIFLRIILPLCKPVLATVALFVAVGQWNDWFTSFLFAPKQELSTLQYELMKLLASSMSQSKSAADIGAAGMAQNAAAVVTPVAMRAAVTVVAALPILVVYPFLQKHFVVGITVGGVKE